MTIPRLKLNLTIRSRLLLLSGVILAVLIGSNLYMRSQVAAGAGVLQVQAQLREVTVTANAALRAFGELKYWLTELEVSWLMESEDMADQSRAELDGQLQAMSVFAPDEVAEIQQHVGTFVDLSFEAVDAYVDENRVLGNSLVAAARESIRAVDAILVKIADDRRAQSTRVETAAAVEAERIRNVAIFILILATLLSVFLTWATLRSVLTPLKTMTAAITDLAGGDIAVDVPSLGKKDEIGDMAKGVEVFKQNLIEAARLEAEKQAEQQAKEER